MSTISHDMSAIFFVEKYALADVERRRLRGELRLRHEAARSQRERQNAGPGLGDRLLTRTGEALVSFGQRLKERGGTGQPQAVRVRQVSGPAARGGC